jgi:hypothetical protein
VTAFTPLPMILRVEMNAFKTGSTGMMDDG